jgi:hypothetical protein
MCLFHVYIKKKEQCNLLTFGLQVLHETQSRLVCERVCFGNLFHSRVGTITHDHEVTDMGDVDKVVGKVTNGVHDVWLCL